MKQGSTLFLKGVLVVLALGVLALCVFAIPPTIGSFDINGYDPILIGIYVPTLPFFFAIYQAYRLLNLIEQNKAFSLDSVKALQKIKYSAISISLLYLAGMPFIFRVADKDDAPGVVLLGLVFACAPIVVAVFAAVLQKLMQSGLELKSENELTV
jgi:hypothetical protein